jgi:hypothetical protein
MYYSVAYHRVTVYTVSGKTRQITHKRTVDHLVYTAEAIMLRCPHNRDQAPWIYPYPHGWQVYNLQNRHPYLH